MKPMGVAWVVVAALVAGFAGAALFHAWQTTTADTSSQQQPPADQQQPGALPGYSPGQSAFLVTDVARLSALVPSQAHTEVDVEYHWANLWFAAEKQNWPLATFYFNQTRQHVRWTVGIQQVRDVPDAGTVDIGGVFDAVDPSSFAAVQLALEDKDVPAFETAYKQALEGCYLCHKAAGKPYLRPQMPTAPPSPLMNLDPDAAWPK